MKYLVDTCGWIEWLSNGDLVKSFAPYLVDITKVVTPTLVQFELYRWVCRERDESTALEVIGMTEQANVVPLDTSLAITAADMAISHKLAMTDAIIYACAQLQKVELITCDKHFAKLTHVKYFEKK